MELEKRIEILEKKVAELEGQVQEQPSVNAEDIFSRYTIKKQAKEIAGSKKINITLQSPGRVLIEIECKSNEKYKEFCDWINLNKPLGANVTLYRKR